MVHALRKKKTDITEALGDARVWNMQYSVWPGQHATDLMPTFFSAVFTSSGNFLQDLALLMVPAVAPLVAGISAAMQSYFASYITTGNPNTNRVRWNFPPTVQWDHPVSGNGEQIANVVNVGDWGFGTVSDDQNKKTPCDFWRGFAAAVTALGGYAPPGTAVAVGVMGQFSGLVVGGGGGGIIPNSSGRSVDPSRNYRGGNQ